LEECAARLPPALEAPLEIHDPSTKASIVKGLGKLLCTFFIVGNQNKVKVWQFTTY
jgi:hypothetical protein